VATENFVKFGHVVFQRLGLGLTLTFNPRRAMVMTDIQAKGQGQRSVGSKDRVETDGRTDGQTQAIALPSSLTRSVIKRTSSCLAL